jgi:HlyD family secretion protein
VRPRITARKTLTDVTTLDLDDELPLEEGGWRRRIITLAVLLGALIAAPIAAFYLLFNSSAANTRPTQDVKVSRATINESLVISAVASAQLDSDLTFQSSGRVAQVDVKVGDAVKQGQVLATLESDDLANATQRARSDLRAAQLKLDDLAAGSTASQLAGANQAVASADAALMKAANAQHDLVNAPTAADLAAAQQAVAAAQAQLTTAQSNRQTLGAAPSAADLAGAQAAVASAQVALTAAQQGAASAHNVVTTASASLQAAEAAYCAADGSPAFCSSPVAPISQADATLLDGGLSGAHATLASAVIAANSTYLNAVNSAASADAGVTSAQAALNAAQQKLSQLQSGPTSQAIASADAAIASAASALNAAQAKLANLQAGPTDSQRSDAQAAVDSAQADLKAAAAKRDDAVRGPTQNEVDQAREAVVAAQLGVDAANIRLHDAQIVAPFDGTVAQINAKPGEFSSQASTTPAIVLLTPDALLLTMNIGETDYSNIRVGKAGGVVFDGIPGQVYPFAITEVGLNPTVTQGVVTYPVKASLVVREGQPRPAPGMNARGQIIAESHPNVLAIPPRAITRRGGDQVVQIRRGGVVGDQVVTTGVSDNNNVEVLSGLNEGDVIVVPALTSASSGPTPQPTLPGGVQ